MADQPSPAALRAWRSFLEAHALVARQLDHELQTAHGLPIAWYDVLVQLEEAGDRLRMSELAEAVLLTRSNCTRLVDRMELEGLVAREADAVDARSKWAVLTVRGRARLVEAAPTHLDGVQRMFGAFVDERSAATLHAAFAAMTAALADGG